MNFFVFFAWIFLVAACTAFPADDPNEAEAKKICIEKENVAEQGLRQIFGYEEGTVVPSTDAEINDHCEGGKQLYKSLLEYKACLPPFPAQIFAASIQSIGNILKKSCGEETVRKNLLKLFRCLENEKKEKINACSVGTRDVIEKLVDGEETKANLIQKMCCLAQVSADCIRIRLAELKCQDPTVSPIEYIEEIQGPLWIDSMDTVCEGFKTMAACEAKIPESFAQIKASVYGNTNSKIGERLMIQPLIKAASKMVN